ncbi:MAG: hypothetical protein ABIN95_02955 [Mucilaginibacter sp.]
MKTRITFILAFLVLSASSVMAQGLLGKLAGAATGTNNAATGVTGVTGSVDNALGTANKVGETMGKLKGLFGKKKAKEAEAAAAAQAAQNALTAALNAAPAAPALAPGSKITVVTVSGADFATLKKLNENIKACGIVQDSKMKFSSTASTIEVTHTSSTDELLKLMQETSKDVFTEKQLEGLEDGKIALKLK